MANTYKFTDEATTIIRFPSVRDFEEYRNAVHERYDARMALVNWFKVPAKEAWVEGRVRHSAGIGAELRGLAYAHHNGETVSTIDHT